MSRSNPFAAGARRAREPRPRRAPDHPPIVRRVRRLGLSMPRPLEQEMYRRWAAMSDAERFEAMAADEASTDDELRSDHAEMLEVWNDRPENWREHLG